MYRFVCVSVARVSAEIPQGPPSVNSNPILSVLTASWTAKLTFVVYFVLTYQMAAYEMLVRLFVFVITFLDCCFPSCFLF